jgi:hypothetical protein
MKDSTQSLSQGGEDNGEPAAVKAIVNVERVVQGNGPSREEGRRIDTLERFLKEKDDSYLLKEAVGRSCGPEIAPILPFLIQR